MKLWLKRLPWLLCLALTATLVHTRPLWRAVKHRSINLWSA